MSLSGGRSGISDLRFQSKWSVARWSALAACLAILGAANTFPNDFTYDDLPLVRDNPVVTGSAPVREIWTRDWWAHARAWESRRDLLYRPLTLLTFRLNHLIAGPDPLSFHLVNVFLHATVAGLVVLVAARMGCSSIMAGVAGLLFAVMPIHVEAVAGIVGRADLLAALFTLLAVSVATAPQPQADASGGHPLARGFLVTISVLAAVLSKESGLAALMIVPLMGLQSAIRNPKSAIRNLTFAALAVLPAAAVYLGLRHHGLEGRLVQATVASPITNMLVDATTAERFWSAWQLLGMYVSKTFWPAKLCVDYSFHAMSLANSPLNPDVWLGFAAVAGLGAGCVLWWRRGQRGLAIACASVLIAYAPVSNTFFLIKTLFAERVWYLPSAFLAIVVAAAGGELTGRVQAAAVPARKWVTAMIAGVALAGLARSWSRSADWRDNASLFESAYEVHPTSAPVLFAYGQHLAVAGDPRGVPLLEQAVRIAPGLVDAQVALGRAYLEHGRYLEAVERLQAAVVLQPDYPGARELLQRASGHLAAGRAEELAQLRRTVEAFPQDLEALLRLGAALVSTGASNDALDAYERADERFADRPEFHRARAVALMTLGRRDAAIEAYRQSLALDELQAQVCIELAMSLLERSESGDPQEAGRLIDRAERLAPGTPQVLIARAEWHALRGERQAAVAIYRRLVETVPPGSIRAGIEVRLKTLQP